MKKWQKLNCWKKAKWKNQIPQLSAEKKKNLYHLERFGEVSSLQKQKYEGFWGLFG